MRKIPEKVQWAKKIFSKYSKSLRVIPEEMKMDYLKNKYQVRRRNKNIAILNQGFKFVVHLVSDKSHKQDKKSQEVENHWQELGYRVFFLEAFNDEDFFNLRNSVKNHKRKKIKEIKNYIQKLQNN